MVSYNIEQLQQKKDELNFDYKCDCGDLFEL